jgi:predicted kinase
MMELIIFVGLQGSGKSTFYRTYFAQTHELVSKDLFTNNKNKNRRQAQLIENALQEGRSVVVDNTNPSIEERAALMRLGRQYGAEIVGYYFDATVKQCLERNKQREGKARVPVVAIYTTAKKLVLPNYEEGFDKLYAVRIMDDGGFEVNTYRNEES